MSTITERPNVQDMVVVHKVFRREFALAPRVVRAVADGDTDRALSVGAHLQLLLGALHHHHTGEDELLWPLLIERAAPQADLVRRIAGQHERVHAYLDRALALLPGWERTATAAQRDELAAAFDQLLPPLVEHLDEEEREMLPLAAEHLSAQEWGRLGERGMAGIERGQLMTFLGALLEDATPDEHTMFLSQVPAQARIAWYFVGRRRYTREMAKMRRDIPAQRRG